MDTTLILASGSPRRVELLKQLGLQPQIRPADIDESCHRGERPQDYVERLAIAKAETVFARLAGSSAAVKTDLIVLGADTTVVCNDQVLGKPQDRAEALAMLQILSGSTHRVFTGTAIVTASGVESLVVATEVDFVSIPETVAESYWQSGEPLGKAGGYAIQGKAACFVKEIRGSYSNVVGLPLRETAELLGSAGVNIF